MKVAIVGSRTLVVEEFDSYLPAETTEIISGGAKGIDGCARMYAQRKGIRFTEYIPQDARYGRGAPLKRNDELVDRADMVIAFWDGNSRGTRYVIDRCRSTGKRCKVIRMEAPTEKVDPHKQ